MSDTFESSPPAYPPLTECPDWCVVDHAAAGEAFDDPGQVAHAILFGESDSRVEVGYSVYDGWQLYLPEAWTESQSVSAEPAVVRDLANKLALAADFMETRAVSQHIPVTSTGAAQVTFSTAVAFVISDELAAAGLPCGEAARRVGIKKKSLKRGLRGERQLLVAELQALATLLDMSSAEVTSRAQRIAEVANDPAITFPAYRRPKCPVWCTKDHDEPRADDDGTFWCTATLFEHSSGISIDIHADVDGLLPSQTVVEHPASLSIHGIGNHADDLDPVTACELGAALIAAGANAKFQSERTVQR